MFLYKRELLRPVRVTNPNPLFARLILEQYGGTASEASAFGQYLTQRYNIAIPEVKRLLTNIGTEELGHWEMVAEMVALNGGAVDWKNSDGQPFTSAYIHVVPDAIACLQSDVAAEQRARNVYLRLLRFIDDPGLRDTLAFLASREELHAAQFMRAIESLQGTTGVPATYWSHPQLDFITEAEVPGTTTAPARVPGPENAPTGPQFTGVPATPSTLSIGVTTTAWPSAPAAPSPSYPTGTMPFEAPPGGQHWRPWPPGTGTQPR